MTYSAFSIGSPSELPNFQPGVKFQTNGGCAHTSYSRREIATQPIILWIELGGKPKWLPVTFGFNDVMRMAPIDIFPNG